MKQQLFLISVIFLCIITNEGFGRPAKNIYSAVLAEAKKYPKLEIRDLYKLAYQAAMGNEHIMNDTAAARIYLDEELASIDSSSREPLIEYLISDSSIIRINLRAFKARQGNSLKLMEAMIQTASNVQPSTDLLQQLWSNIETLAEEQKIPFNKMELDEYFQKMERQNFPAVHHSKVITDIYQPSYRIISKGTLSLILEKERK
jgi:hypothetical protein